MTDKNVTATGVDAIMESFDRLGTVPFYSVWRGKDMLFSWNNPNDEEGRDYLLQNLLAAEASENSDVLKIKFHPAKEKNYITDKSPVIGTLFVRVCPYVSYNSYSRPPAAVSGVDPELKQLLVAMNSKLSAMEQPYQPDEQETFLDNQDKMQGMINGVTELMKIPIISQLIGKIFNVGNAAALPAMSGLEPDKFNEAIKILRENDSDLDNDLFILASIAKNNNTAFNIILAQLRSFKA